ncbi:protein kinase [Vibrio sp. CAIM 722]|uniref:Protein kinase n=1 Tax=Vibrio eleionomae TaxID=2653505 RepID=A0A7X4LPX9_9VIBR|nr:leucine-rich repeat-containing protein kinase family protein [Vibrio eleionomae]MZI95831.1 protein kinase [Vibrio eleionomae]
MHTLEQLRSGSLKGLRRLKLACGLTDFPREIFSLADTLEILDLTGNQLSSLPDDLDQLTHLKVIFCSQNQFTQLPKVLGKCCSLSMIGFKSNQIEDVPPESLPPQLRWLILTDNCIRVLPERIGQCDKLQKLMLAGNKLSRLPESLAQCQRLELMRVSANRLNTFPEWVFALPKLTWFAYAGNPFVEPIEQQALIVEMMPIDWHNITTNVLLGEGASGLIYQADLMLENDVHRVAVKLFKGTMTSDGLPLCEMAATIKAGQHRALTQTIGRISNHPEDTDGIIMNLIPKEFVNLAGPPSLDSCTRDVYPADKQFTTVELFRIIGAIAQAVCHLHQQGIVHGDLYAHNILTTPTGEALLSDYGAASFIDLSDPEQSASLQRLEVRAFGCLLEELIARCDDIDTTMQAQLNKLVSDCQHIELSKRPTFTEIVDHLHQVQSMAVA